MKYAYYVMLAASAMPLVLALAAPYLAYAGQRQASDLAYNALFGFCHQRADRSFTLFDDKMGVCARCFGVYLGLFTGTVSWGLFWKKRSYPPNWILLAALTPLMLDGFTQLMGLRESINTMRLATGLLFGLVLPYYLVPAVMEIGDKFTVYIQKSR